MKSCLYFSLLFSVMFCGSAFAACTPSPDCASLGYTATSCPNGGVKCPFDTSKWHCDNPCDSEIYKYDCKSANESGGAGTACGGKYASCKCVSRYMWSEGVCKKATAVSGTCCNNGSSPCTYSSSSFEYCKHIYGYVDCSTMQSSCRASSGTPRFLNCLEGSNEFSSGYVYKAAKFECDY